MVCFGGIGGVVLMGCHCEFGCCLVWSGCVDTVYKGGENVFWRYVSWDASISRVGLEMRTY